MNRFFEMIAERDHEKEYLAVYGIDGSCLGKTALYARSGETVVLMEGPDLLRGTEDFPEDTGTGRRTGIIRTARGRVFADQICGKRKLVICGAGHVSLPVIRIGKLLSYEITVIEDREKFAALAREAGADHVHCGEFAACLRDLKGDLNTAYIVVTRGHHHDIDCLREILQGEYAYVGLMASRKRGVLAREQLCAEGFDREKINEIHTPIGVPICSETPEEIAVSIMAQVIQIMNARGPENGYTKDMIAEILKALKSGRSSVLAMIIQKIGEAPREPGTKLLVCEDGRFIGTAGGGYAEAVILQEARKMLAQGKGTEQENSCRTMKISLFSEDPKEESMLCGGTIEVLMEVIRK